MTTNRPSIVGLGLPFCLFKFFLWKTPNTASRSSSVNQARICMGWMFGPKVVW